MSMKVVTRINQDVEVEIDIDDVIGAINELDIKKRYNYIAQLFNGIDLGDKLALTSEQVSLIANYLKTELSVLENLCK